MQNFLLIIILFFINKNIIFAKDIIFSVQDDTLNLNDQNYFTLSQGYASDADTNITKNIYLANLDQKDNIKQYFNKNEKGNNTNQIKETQNDNQQDQSVKNDNQESHSSKENNTNQIKETQNDNQQSNNIKNDNQESHSSKDDTQQGQGAQNDNQIQEDNLNDNQEKDLLLQIQDNPMQRNLKPKLVIVKRKKMETQKSKASNVNIKIQSIIQEGKGFICFIDGEIYKEKDKIYGNTIKKINSNNIIITNSEGLDITVEF